MEEMTNATIKKPVDFLKITFLFFGFSVRSFFLPPPPPPPPPGTVDDFQTDFIMETTLGGFLFTTFVIVERCGAGPLHFRWKLFVSDGHVMASRTRCVLHTFLFSVTMNFLATISSATAREEQTKKNKQTRSTFPAQRVGK